ncbi:hypothetical protein SCANM63S_07342 [Streptomyces canarius]
MRTKLVKRGTTGCTLTRSGEALLTTAERVELELKIGSQRGTSDRVTGTVRVGAPDGIGNYFLAEQLAALAAVHPDLVIQLSALPVRSRCRSARPTSSLPSSRRRKAG